MHMCHVHSLGVIAYADALDLQNRLVAERSLPGGVDRLLLLEHPHTYTLGSAGHDSYILMSPEQREQFGIAVHHTDRGGDVTYHGFGQLIAYPIIELDDFQRGSVRGDVVGYVRKLEQVLIDTLSDYGVRGKRIQGLVGVWVETPRGDAKIAALGVRVNVRGVTKHGVALNVNTDLRYFEGIVPCGIHDKGVTSLAALSGHPVAMTDVQTRLTAHFGRVFQRTMIAGDLD